MTTDTIALSTAWIHQRAYGERPAHTLLVGASILTCSHRFGSAAFDLAAHSTTVTDNPADTMAWLTERLEVMPAQLLLWRAADIVVPSLISACETTRDTMTAARLLRALDRIFDGEVIDVAEQHGGSTARSFDAVMDAAGLPFKPMSKADLHCAHSTGCHGDIREHLAMRATSTFRLWLHGQDGAADLIADIDAWVATSNPELSALDATVAAGNRDADGADRAAPTALHQLKDGRGR